jgi:hypothetical protein
VAEKPWCYDELFEDVRKAWDDHDKTCESLRWLWLGRSGGVTCLSDITDCSVCGVTFYNEGVLNINWKASDPDAQPDYRCECCRRVPAVAEESPRIAPREEAV